MATNFETFDFQEIEQCIKNKASIDPAYKQRLLNNPKAVISEELGQQLPPDLTIQVLQQTPNHLYLLLPYQELIQDELAEDELTEDELASVIGGIKD
ncbi:NHLP leader peptide family RiPP precursor [Aetokthonos hydrillicola Thurmond2011]|jgi:hypothetical protein|uniref:NHLP leader peptide family RiPP n=1 Tax=Aetokthonos hydrillicola Thurmond2011 TaxID=2712845 RepID=A0AAP5I900_9CYAN|nr:NHLP leader peptide family RiPP precursor [Aetokthonos hydrillicola]MBO3458670.1 NHLP leader peptide family natural product precursor [Aetokthonos hydrillicola CCALA 1050]MBW4588023.1 NHLP leader peptide family RiPP precursor [Aetokthonos hydrillicola CCALA 1050]MDR9897025.1 NHLP leader peptide family RiPP precursor [Aetokthonos hydrillicola Thurmond2011]